jgi:hypothetical protein
LPITTEVDLIGNLHNQLQKLNDFTFSDMDGEKFLSAEFYHLWQLLYASVPIFTIAGKFPCDNIKTT